MPEPILELRNVSKSFGMTHALTDMSLALFPGEVHALVGENGAGKSTMIKIMTGIHQPTSGTVAVNSEPRAIPGPSSRPRPWHRGDLSGTHGLPRSGRGREHLHFLPLARPLAAPAANSAVAPGTSSPASG